MNSSEKINLLTLPVIITPINLFQSIIISFPIYYYKNRGTTKYILIVFQECAFKKLKSGSALKVSFQGNMRVQGDRKCNRWYFKFNGNECSGPMTIDAAVYNNWTSGNHNLLHHRSFEGYCENIPQGAVRVELWVGKCSGGHALGDAYTGWQSVSRLMIEEVSRPQS